MNKHVDAAEQCRREAVLAEIARAQAARGPHVARAYPERARQFMPFAALKGYEEMAAEMENTPEEPGDPFFE